MPYINIRLGTKLNNSQKTSLHESTTALMNSIMGKRREVTMVHIQESEAQQWSANAETLSARNPIAAYVDIKVTQGTNTAEEKAAMISATITMLKDIVGATQDACYVVIDDIPADSWGYDGQTQTRRAASKH